MLLSDMPAKTWLGQNLTTHTCSGNSTGKGGPIASPDSKPCVTNHIRCQSVARQTTMGLVHNQRLLHTLHSPTDVVSQARLVRVRPARLPKITIRSLLPAEWRAISLLHNLGLGSSPSAQSPPTWLAPLVKRQTDTTSHSQLLFCSFAFQTDREVAHSHARAKLPHTVDIANYLLAYFK